MVELEEALDFLVLGANCTQAYRNSLRCMVQSIGPGNTKISVRDENTNWLYEFIVPIKEDEKLPRVFLTQDFIAIALATRNHSVNAISTAELESIVYDIVFNRCPRWELYQCSATLKRISVRWES